SPGGRYRYRGGVGGSRRVGALSAGFLVGPTDGAAPAAAAAGVRSSTGLNAAVASASQRRASPGNASAGILRKSLAAVSPWDRRQPHRLAAAIKMPHAARERANSTRCAGLEP